jgi:DNA-binding HxlR family transcriptional regulator
MGGKIRLEDRECPLSTALGYVGEWWTMLILHDCFDGYSRFDQFQDNIGLSSSMLTARLRTLVDQGLLEKRAYQSRPVRYEYLLTEKGHSLRPVLVAMAAWTNSRLDKDERSMILVDTETGEEVEPVLVDATSGRRVDDTRHAFTAGPAAGPEMSARYANRASRRVVRNSPVETGRRRTRR